MTRSPGTIAVVLLLAVSTAGCGSPKSRPGDVRAACERYVKDRLRQPVATFSDESVRIGPVRTRGSMWGVVGSAIRSPAPGGPTQIRSNFTCTVERHGKRWDLRTLTGLQQ